MQTRTFGLVQSHLHDFAGDTFDFDIHLQGADTVTAARNFKVHVAEVVFITEDIRQNHEFVAFFHQTHRDTGNR